MLILNLSVWKNIGCLYIFIDIYVFLRYLTRYGKLKIERVNKDMYSLVFDTTASGVVVGLYDDDKALAMVEKNMEFGQAEELAVSVKNVLDNAGIDFSKVGLLGVCVGPGSFTGVRASIAFARALVMGNPDMKVTGVSAFDVYAQMFDKNALSAYNAVIIETKRDDFYFQLFDEKLNKITEALALDREEIINLLKNRQTSFIGDGVDRFLAQPSGLQIKSVELSNMISVEALFKAVSKKNIEKKLDFPKPLYIRNADACVK